MLNIINKSSFYKPERDPQPYVSVSNGALISLRTPQIIVGVSLTPHWVLKLDEKTPYFPVLLDTGLNINFSINANHLSRWTKLNFNKLNSTGNTDIKGISAELYQSNIWLYRLPYKKLEEYIGRTGRRPPAVLLEKSRTIAVVSARTPEDPRLPCLGLHALVINHLQLIVNGDGTTFAIRRSVRSCIRNALNKITINQKK